MRREPERSTRDNRLLDIRADHDLRWDEALKPVGEGEFDKEAFGPWWERHGTRLGHLHLRIAEQWIHRHWRHSPYC
jgi:hypothetical protein